MFILLLFNVVLAGANGVLAIVTGNSIHWLVGGFNFCTAMVIALVLGINGRE